MGKIGLLGCAKIIVEQVANVRPNERLLVITDNNYFGKTADLIFETGLGYGVDSAKIVTTPPTGTFAEGEVSYLAKSAALQADVIFACTSTSFPISARDQIIREGKRVIQMHNVRDELVLRTVPIDLNLLRKRVEKLLTMVRQSEKVHWTSLEGTDITFSLKDCMVPLVYDGVCRPGEFDAVPYGAIDMLPVPETGNGVIVVDGSLGRYGLVRTPLRMTVKDGKFTKIEGGVEAAWLDRSLKKALATGDENANHWAEFLMGLNPNAQVNCYGGSLLEDERHLGAISVGWGRDAHLGGRFNALFHGDGIALNPTLTLDGTAIMNNGIPTAEVDQQP